MALKVGLQMYSVRKAMKEDPIKAIAHAAEIGYKYIELANVHGRRDPGCGFNVRPSDLKNAIAPYGAQIVSSHVYPMDEGNIDAVLNYHAELGTKYLLSKPFDNSREELLKNCENLNRIGEKCRKLGIQHGIHASFFTYFADGTWPLDLITANTDPELVKYELDTYWILRSGYDPIERMKMYGNRVFLVHQKDLPKNYKKPINLNSVMAPGTVMLPGDYGELGEDDFCEIGTGQLDIQAIIDAAVQYTSAEYIFLEQDFTKLGEMKSIEVSMDAFRKYKNIVWD